MTFKSRAAALALIALLLTGCSSATKFETTREAPDGAGPYDTLIVIAIAETQALRRRFENNLSKNINEGDSKALASMDVLPVDSRPNRELVTAAVAETGADAVVISRLSRLKVNPTETKERTAGVTATRRRDRPVVDFFRYDYTDNTDESYLSAELTVGITTDVFDTASGDLLYTLQSTSEYELAGYEIIDEVSAGVAKRMRRAGLVRR